MERDVRLLDWIGLGRGSQYPAMVQVDDQTGLLRTTVDWPMGSDGVKSSDSGIDEWLLGMIGTTSTDGTGEGRVPLAILPLNASPRIELRYLYLPKD